MKRSGFLTFLLSLGLLGVAGGALGALLAGRHDLLDLIGMFAAPALTCAVIGVALALLLRRWKLALGYALAGLALFLCLRPQWFPQAPSAAPEAEPVRVYFANVWAGNRETDAIAASVHAAEADVVALVEITDEHAAALDRILKDHPYRASTRPARFFRGGPRVVIAAKWPVKEAYLGLQDGLAVGDTVVSTPQGELRVIAAHLTRPWPMDGRRGEQRRQADRLARRITGGQADRVLVVGDFNATGSSDVLRDFASQARLSPAPARLGTWPRQLPGVFRIAIDNAFAGPGLAIVSRELGQANGSDHRPIVVEVAPAR